MNILKSKFSQMILVGLLFAFISGSFSFFAVDLLKKQDLEKQIIIIDVINENPLSKELARLSVAQSFALGRTINQELHDSINYTQLRYQRDPRLKGGCHTVKYELTDRSIFVETNHFPTSNQKIMNKCLTNLFALSFERLKIKITQNANEEIARVKFATENLRERMLEEKLAEEKKKEEKLAEDKKKEEKLAEDKTRLVITEICKDMDPIYNQVLKEVNSFGKKKSLEVNDEYMISMSSLFQNILTLNTLANECQQKNGNLTNNIASADSSLSQINRQIQNLVKTQKGLKKAKDILLISKFNDVFKTEKLSSGIKSQTTYLTKKNALVTFSLLGFIFGVLLVYNFRISK